MGAQNMVPGHRPPCQSLNCGIELNNMSVDPAVVYYVCIHRYDVTKTHTCTIMYGTLVAAAISWSWLSSAFLLMWIPSHPLSYPGGLDGWEAVQQPSRTEARVHLESAAVSTIFCLCGRGRATCPVSVAAPFASMKNQAEILFRLICCERKILFRLKK